MKRTLSILAVATLGLAAYAAAAGTFGEGKRLKTSEQPVCLQGDINAAYNVCGGPAAGAFNVDTTSASRTKKADGTTNAHPLCQCGREDMLYYSCMCRQLTKKCRYEWTAVDPAFNTIQNDGQPAAGSSDDGTIYNNQCVANAGEGSCLNRARPSNRCDFPSPGARVIASFGAVATAVVVALVALV